jgi:hypothetical protein
LCATAICARGQAEPRPGQALTCGRACPLLQHDPHAFRIYADDAHVVDAGAGDDLEDAARRLWRREHIDAIDAAAGIKAAIVAVRSAQDALDDAVRAARSRGLSWAKIGEAAGVSAQAAHERWSKVTESNTSPLASERASS